MTSSAAAPYPPLELATRVCSLAGRTVPLLEYQLRGREARSAIESLLDDDWSFEHKRVLDFGCGAGRTLRHFLPEAGDDTEVWGSDIDEPSVAWLQANLSPPLHVVCTAADPPLPFEDGHFDLIWALSVFTHLTSPLEWLTELHRVLKPGGLLIATYMGRHNGRWFTGEPWDEDRMGMTILRREQSWDKGGPMVLMSDWWVDAHWGRAFELVRREPVHGQTWALLRKRDVRITAAELAERSDDPREFAALSHSIELLQRDRELALEQLRGDYEKSFSWRVTAPWRDAVRYARARSRRPRFERGAAR